MKLDKTWGRFALFLILVVVASLSACTGTQPAGQAASSEAADAGGGAGSSDQNLQRLSAAEVASGIGQGLIIPWPPPAGTIPALIVE